MIDLGLLNWLSKAEVNYPDLFDQMKTQDGTYNGKDLSMFFLRTNQRPMGKCLQEIATVGFVDTKSIGCVASQVVLYVSLVFIVGVVGIRFVMAVLFAWFFSWKLGNFKRETYEERMRRAREIENWTDDIYRPAPSQYRPNVQKNGIPKNNKRTAFLPSTSRFTPSESVLKGVGVGGRPSTAYGMLEPMPYKRSATASIYGGGSSKSLKPSPSDTPGYRQSRSSTSLATDSQRFADNPCPFPLHNVVPQPAPDWEPFGYPLCHTICLVTAYSESVEGLRTTLDSLATTDYPNSHKLILIIADGMVKGAGNTATTPEICLSMMKDFVIPPNEVEAHSYVAIADGHKRHNMAKVFAGFYKYDDATVEGSKQQRVPVVLVSKVGNPLEVNDAKPGNRGKRDSQIVLMAFLQKVMFDERMTTFEYEFFNSIWRVTGISPDRYELVLCVDADTKVFPDSLSRMVSCMINDYEIMGLCGETKIANKAETWVTMIQGLFPRSSPRIHAPKSMLFVCSIRILHLPSPEQGIRVHVRRCHLFARLFQHVPYQGAKGRRRILGPCPCEPGRRGALLRERGRHPPQEEPVAPRRGSLPHHAHAQDLPQAQERLLSASRLQDRCSRHLPRVAVAAPSLDQFNDP